MSQHLLFLYQDVVFAIKDVMEQFSGSNDASALWSMSDLIYSQTKFCFKNSLILTDIGYSEKHFYSYYLQNITSIENEQLRHMTGILKWNLSKKADFVSAAPSLVGKHWEELISTWTPDQYRLNESNSSHLKTHIFQLSLVFKQALGIFTAAVRCITG